MRITKYFLFYLLLILSSQPTISLALENKKVTIAAGPIISRYYLIATKLCYFITESNPGTQCQVIPTNGSIDNLKLLKENKTDFAIAQSNLALEAFNALENYKKSAPYIDLRQVLNLYKENFNILVKDNDQIKMFSDLSGKRVGFAAKNSATYLTYECLKEFYSGLNFTEIEVKTEEYAEKLCNNEIDALIIMAGHPSPLVNLIANTCNIEFLSIEANTIHTLLQHNKGFEKSIIKKHIYSGIAHDQHTIGVTALLLTNRCMDATILTNLINYFKCHIDDFKHTDKLLETLDNDFFTNHPVLPLFEELN